MSRVGKKYAAAKKQIEPRPYTVEDAMGVLKKVHYAKFNETIEVPVSYTHLTLPTIYSV